MKAISFISVALCVLALCVQVEAGQLKLVIKKSDVDLENRTLSFKINRPADSAEVVIRNWKGDVIHEKLHVFEGTASGTKLSVTWPDLLGDSDNFILDLKVTDIDSYWVGHQIDRWYVEIPHDDIVFESGKWDIRPSEETKLQEPLRILLDAIKTYGKARGGKLYVAGYTDTVGNLADNRELSRKRARSIAKYFKSHGVKGFPIYIRGFGEEVPAVETGDNVDEERNRRAQYILSNQPPEISGPGSWQKL